MQDKILYIDVILPLKHGVFTYHLTETDILPETGFSVIVPLGKKLYTGITVATHANKPDFNTRAIAHIPANNPIIKKIHLKFWQWIAGYYFCSIGEVMDAALPAFLKIKSEAVLTLSDNCNISEIKAQLPELVCWLEEHKCGTVSQIIDLINTKNALVTINELLFKRYLTFVEEIQKYKPLKEKKYFLNNELAEKELRAESQTPAKKQLIDFFRQNNRNGYSIGQIIEQTGISAHIIKQMLKKKCFYCNEIEISRLDTVTTHELPEISFSEHQQTALNSINRSFKENKPVLFQGVTGSGKTEIYINLIEQAINSGKQVLYLLPEIVISSQIIKRLQTYFGTQACVYHSRINPAKRAEIWLSILKNEQLKIIIGPRSTIFLPYQNLGLIIVDEEHDAGYKQQEPSPRYNARDAAVVLAQIFNANLILGSATPSLESLYNTQIEKYNLIKLNVRYGNAPLPAVEVVDYRKFYRRHEVVAHLTPQLKQNIEEALKKEEQVILLQNRRGLSPFVQCKKCGYVPHCKHCDVSLTVHKNNNKLVCHYCGFSAKVFEKCPQCLSEDIKQQGFGTEKVEDELKALFPDHSIARLDFDAARSKAEYETILNRFAIRDIDILIGTQMVSKGLDFDGVNLVGVLNADNLLSASDFRSSERGFQMLMQFAGRAGRRKQQGKLIIQTSQPEHHVIQCIKNSLQSDFILDELKTRRQFFYPPFVRLIQITVKHFSREKTDKVAETLVKLFNKAKISQVLGPYIPPVPKIKSQQQSQLLIKLDKNSRLTEYRSKIMGCINAIQNTDGYKSVVIIADIDPY